MATQLMKLAAPLDDPFAIGGAHAAVGVTSMWLGKFLPAREHLEQTAAIFDRDLARYLPMHNAPVIPSDASSHGPFGCSVIRTRRAVL